MIVAAGRKRPVVAALYREALPPRLSEIEELAEVRLTKADGLAKAMDGADVLYQWHSFSPALRENWVLGLVSAVDPCLGCRREPAAL